MAHLGHMYANGVGVAASNESAHEWFHQAARRNHPSGQYGLGYLHLSGYGVPKDAKKAFKYFSAASEQVEQLLLLEEHSLCIPSRLSAKRPDILDMFQAT